MWYAIKRTKDGLFYNGLHVGWTTLGKARLFKRKGDLTLFLKRNYRKHYPIAGSTNYVRGLPDWDDGTLTYTNKKDFKVVKIQLTVEELKNEVKDIFING